MAKAFPPASSGELEATTIIGPRGTSGRQVVLREAKMLKVIEPAFEFTCLDPSHPILQELRQREKLDEVVGPAKTEFEKVLLVKRWTGLQWKFGSPNPYPPWNALTILDWIRSGKTSGFCGQYGMVFVQSLLSLGIQARYVELGMKVNPICHWDTEVWLNDFGKWAVVDSTPNSNLGCYYERDGIPQNALELHLAYLDGEEDAIKRVQDPVVLAAIGQEPPPLSLEMFYNFRVCMNQNQLDFPPPFTDIDTTFDRYNDMVEWEDEKTVLWEANPGPANWAKRRPSARRARNPQQLYWTMHNGVDMQLRWFDGDMYVIYLKAHFPGFLGFLVRFDGGEWTPAPDFLPYEAKPGKHKIEARTKSKDGSLGPVSHLDFECEG